MTSVLTTYRQLYFHLTQFYENYKYLLGIQISEQKNPFGLDEE